MAGGSAGPRRACLLSLLLIIGGARAYAQSVGGPSTSMDNLDVSLALRTGRFQYEQGDELPLLLRMENRGSPRVSLWRPDLTQRTVVLEVFRDGLAVAPQASWDARPARTHITLWGGGSRQQTLELSRLFPTMTLPPGRYEVRATVHAGPGVEMETNALPFEIVEMPPDEQAAFAAYLRAVGGGEYSDVVEMGTEFLERHPDSRFADALRLELGFAQAKLGDADGAIATYGDVVASDKAAAWRKREAAFQTAWIYHAKGEVGEAIRRMRRLRSPEAARWAKKWRRAARDAYDLDSPGGSSPGAGGSLATGASGEGGGISGGKGTLAGGANDARASVAAGPRSAESGSLWRGSSVFWWVLAGLLAVALIVALTARR